MNIKRNKFIFISNYNLWKLFNFGQCFVIYVLIKLYPFVMRTLDRCLHARRMIIVLNEIRKNKFNFKKLKNIRSKLRINRNYPLNNRTLRLL